ncbi:IucA/IucC family protein [Fodinicola feengrottensis]|uniref:IucA/IucC family protein n=1 Tax=Fodinicola feengrottensis TaxID=435914 RepID=UPI0013D893B7
MRDAEARAYAPELRGSFALHWFAAAQEIVSSDSSAPMMSTLDGPAVPTGMVAVPAHPWQAADLVGRPAVVEALRRETRSRFSSTSRRLGFPRAWPFAHSAVRGHNHRTDCLRQSGVETVSCEGTYCPCSGSRSWGL